MERSQGSVFDRRLDNFTGWLPSLYSRLSYTRTLYLLRILYVDIKCLWINQQVMVTFVVPSELDKYKYLNYSLYRERLPSTLDPICILSPARAVDVYGAIKPLPETSCNRSPWTRGSNRSLRCGLHVYSPPRENAWPSRGAHYYNAAVVVVSFFSRMSGTIRPRDRSLHRLLITPTTEDEKKNADIARDTIHYVDVDCAMGITHTRCDILHARVYARRESFTV